MECYSFSEQILFVTLCCFHIWSPFSFCSKYTFTTTEYSLTDDIPKPAIMFFHVKKKMLYNK